MKIELGKIVNSVEIIRRLNKQSLPVKVAFRLLSLTKILDEHLKSFEETRISLIRKYGEENEDGSIKVKQENVEDFVKELNELLIEEIEVNFNQFSIDDFPDSVSMTTDELVNIEWLLNT